METVPPYRTWLKRQLSMWPHEPGTREQVHDALLDDLAAPNSADVYFLLPGLIQKHFAPVGFAWNGIYQVEDRHRLRLVAKAGPLVCGELERSGGLGSSGMCWDTILLGQPQVADPVSLWPGYVSCDNESGLKTVAGMTYPLRNAQGNVVAVWDLDATEHLLPADLIFFLLFFQSFNHHHPACALDAQNRST